VNELLQTETQLKDIEMFL